MEIENNKEGVPFAYYTDLYSKMDPQEASRRTGTPFDGSAFSLRLLHTDYRLSWPDYAISSDRPDGYALSSLPAQTFLLRYLLEGRQISFSGAYKTFREMPWGEMYHKPFAGRCLTRAAFTFGTRVEKFAAAMEKLGGKKLSYGDAGYEIELLPGYWMRLMVWEGDEEFPPNSQILYSDNFQDGFSPEDRVVSGDILISVVKLNM